MLSGYDCLITKMVDLYYFLHITAQGIVKLFIRILTGDIPQGISPLYGKTLVILTGNSPAGILRLCLQAKADR